MSRNILKLALKLFRQTDIFAKPVQLLIKQENGHKTLFGATLTLCLLVFFFYFLVANLCNLSLRVDPSSYTTQIYHSNPDYYLYDQSNFTFTFSFTGSDARTYIDESIYVVEAYLATKVVKIVNGSSVDEWSQKELPIAPCTIDLIRQVELQEYFYHQDLPTNYCVDWNRIDKIEIQGKFDAPIFNYIFIQFRKCTQSSKKSKECRTDEEIDQELRNNYFSMQLSSLVIDVKDPNQPFTPIGQDTFTTISSKIFKEITFTLEPVTIVSDFGLMQNNYQEMKSLRFKQMSEMLDFNEGELIMNLVIKLDPTEQVYYRNYRKIQQIFGELGGLWNVLFTLALLLQKPINLLSYYVTILNSLFQFEQPTVPNSPNQVDEESDLTKRREIVGRDSFIFPSFQQKAFQRLQSIRKNKKKLEELEKSDEQNKQAKTEIFKALSQSIKQYFRTFSKKLTLSWTDYFYFIKCFKQSNDYKQHQIEFSIKKIIKQMDILYIIKKLQEIDKLKMILLNESQIQVFDYLQKPTIPVDPEAKTFTLNQQYFSILKPMKSDYQRSLEAQAAFKELAENFDDPINEKLINSIDQHILDLLEIRVQKQSWGDLSQSDSQIIKNQVLRIDVKQKGNI